MRTFREFLSVTVLPNPVAGLLGFKPSEPAPPPERRGWGEGPAEICRKAEQLLNQTIGEIRVVSGTGIKSVTCHFLCEGADGVLTVELTGTAVAGDASDVPRFIKKLIRRSREHMLLAGVLIECDLKKLYVSSCPLGEAIDLLHQFHFSVHTHVMALASDPD